MSSAPAQRLTPEEYLTQERRAATRSEYVNGQIYAMTGASREHNLIAGNTFATLHAQLRSRACEVYASDMRVKLTHSPEWNSGDSRQRRNANEPHGWCPQRYAAAQARGRYVRYLGTVQILWADLFSPTAYLKLLRCVAPPPNRSSVGLSSVYQSAMLSSRLFSRFRPCRALHLCPLGIPRLKYGGFRALTSVSATGMYTYPDVVVVCGVPQFEDEEVDTLLNPSVIVEVLSDSTERYDRGAKFAHYRTLDSLTDYLLIAQDSYLVEQYTRQPDGQWLFSANTLLTAALTLASIGCTLSLAAIYEKITLPPDPSVPQHPTPRT